MNRPLKLLLSNDDGYRASGLLRLLQTLSPWCEITVAAPARNCSGASNALSLHRPLRVRRMANSHAVGGFYCVAGTPADCVHLAVTGMLDSRPDMVIAGVNCGANMGDDVLYSGTVAAAIEGRFLGLPAIAVSLDGECPRHYITAAEVVVRVLKKLRAEPLPEDTILNINVPDRPLARLRGLRATRLGARHPSQGIIAETGWEEVADSVDSVDISAPPAPADSANSAALFESSAAVDSADISAPPAPAHRVYRIGPIGDTADAGPGTDFHAVQAGAASITPLQIDMTRHHALPDLAAWLADIEALETPPKAGRTRR